MQITTGFYLDTRYTKKDGTCTVKINVTNRSNFHISTGVSVLPKHWDGRTVTRGDRSNRAKNAKLTMIMDKVNSATMEVERSGDPLSDKELRIHIQHRLAGTPSGAFTLVDALQSHLKNKKANQTILSYLQTEDKIFDFDKDARLSAIDYSWLVAFNNHLLDSGLSVNSAAIHMRNLRAVINHAIDNEWMDSYPFRRFKIKTQETPKRSLSAKQLQVLRTYQVEEYLEEYRDIFMLTFYLCGINIVDLAHLTAITEDGRIEYYRSKTGKFYSIKVEPEALAIINKYRGEKYLLNIRERYFDYTNYTNRINAMLKRIGKLSWIDKVDRLGVPYQKKHYTSAFPGLTLYWARHSWASIAASIGVSDDVISQGLGHSTTNATTAIYIDRDRTLVDDANRRVIDSILTV